MGKRDVNEPVKFEKELNQYIVKYPDEEGINVTIDTLRQYVPHKQKNIPCIKNQIFSLIKRTSTEITLMSKTYWVVSAVLFILGFLLVNSTAYDPLTTLVIISPLPFMFGLVEVFKAREQGLLEMEMTCKFSVYEIMLTRLLLIGLYNISLSTMLTIAFTSLIDSASMWEIIFVWLTPLTFFASISLWISIRFRGFAFLMMIVSLWVFFSFLFLSRPSWLHTLIQMNLTLYILFMGVGTFLLGWQMKQLIKRYSSFEGSETVEISY